MFPQFQQPQEDEQQGIFTKFAAPLMAQRQNALMGMMQQHQAQDPFMQMFQQAHQYNALAQNGGPTNAAAAQMGGAKIPTGEMALKIQSGLESRGIPAHIAQAFVINMQDESNLNPGINEAKPIVPGSRGGFGLYQLTGPRRREYEAFAQERGVSLDNVDAQLDFLMLELRGKESGAAKRIFSAPDTATAAQEIVNKFLRPSESHRVSRAAKYSRL